MKGHWIKPMKAVYSPRHLVSVICETDATWHQDGVNRVTHSMKCVHVICSRNRRKQWQPVERYTFLTGECFHQWLESWAQPKTRTYVVSPIASIALAHTRFWDRITARGALWAAGAGDATTPPEDGADGPAYGVSTLVLRGKPDILRYTVAGRGLCWLSARQYVDATEDSLASYVGHRWQDDPVAAGSSLATTRAPAERAELWLRVMQRLADWWEEVKGGPWGVTTGALAINYFKSRLAPKSVLSHGDRGASEIEERAIFGGRAQVYSLCPVGFGEDGPASAGSATPPDGQFGGGGKLLTGSRGSQPPPPNAYPLLPGPLYHIDIRSMYPYLLATREFPVELMHVWPNSSIKTVRDLLKDYAVIASVRLCTRLDEYPYRDDQRGRIIYPVGEFDTCLCGDELRAAIDEGYVTQVYQHASYHKGRPFAQMASELIALRVASRGNPAFELFIKGLSNTFGGKLAQRKGQWGRRAGMLAEHEWGEWIYANTTTGERQRFRGVAGLVQQYTTDKESSRQLGSCFAYLTMYGRMMMRLIRETCPTRSIFSQDTDGLWVSRAALDTLGLTGDTTDAQAGSLRVCDRTTRAQWYSPKHYWTDHGWILSGYHESLRISDGLTFIDRYVLAPVLGADRPPPDTVTEVVRRTELRCMDVGGRVGPDGWVTPYHLGGKGRLEAPVRSSPLPVASSGPKVASADLLSGL